MRAALSAPWRTGTCAKEGQPWGVPCLRTMYTLSTPTRGSAGTSMQSIVILSPMVAIARRAQRNGRPSPRICGPCCLQDENEEILRLQASLDSFRRQSLPNNLPSTNDSGPRQHYSRVSPRMLSQNVILVPSTPPNSHTASQRLKAVE